MTTAPDEPTERIETADEYGRRQKCFRSYRRHPFTFQSHVADIQSTKEITEKDGLIAQMGLKMAPLPNPQLTGDVFDEHHQYRDSLDKLLHDSPSKVSLSATNTFMKELFIPASELDLGPCPENDLHEYLHQVRTKRYGNPFKQWLPLTCTRTEMDESLNFPPGLNRLWELLGRELDLDEPILSNTATNLVREQSKSLTALEFKNLLLQQTKIKPYQYSCLDPLSPPLSPVSDDDTPFIPDGDVAIIDLVSEPSSPGRAAIKDIQRDMDSDPIISSTFMTSPSAGELPQLFQTCHAVIQEAKVEAPIVFTSSGSPSEANVFTNICLPLIDDNGEDVSNSLEQSGQFEDAFMTLLEDRRYYANQLVNQERFHPEDSLCRVSVPLLDFDITPPEWADRHFTARTHFTFLKKTTARCFNMLPIARDPRSDASLRWAVFPLEKRPPIIVDEVAVPEDIVAKYLPQEPATLLSSDDFVLISPHLDVLCIQEDEEIEPLFILDGETDAVPPVSIQQLESPDCINLEQRNKANSPNCINLERLNKANGLENKHFLDLSRPIRRKFDDEGVRLLPKSYDTSATSILLHNFMELRGVKRPRLDTDAALRQHTGDSQSITGNEASAINNHEAVPLLMTEELPPAPIPNIEVPSEKASFIISVDLARPILRRLENTWAPEKLIDMDYSHHNITTWLPGAAQSKGLVSSLSFEADISLSPGTGIIITNILKVKQRPLPGSQSQTPLRERVEKVSQRYETLIVLVSESQSRGEFMGTLAPSNTAAYADFLSFATALDGNVDVHFIPGATETMASWVLAFMCQHSSGSKAISRFLTSEETPWEIFLRQAGMNVTAAKVLSKTLFEEAGTSGLALYLNMTVSERVARFGLLLGGEKVLLLTAKALDRGWGD